jgi:glycosyltransferase involved in cell wall biosynthesis
LKNQKIHVVPNGVDSTIFIPTLKSISTNQILFVGRLSEEKNVELFITLAEHFPTNIFKVITISSGTNYETNLIKTISRKPNMRIRCNLTPKQLAIEYQHSLTTVITSRNEQFPLNYLESIACGTPVITPPLPSLVALQRKINYGITTTNYNPSEYKKIIFKFINMNNTEMSLIKHRCRKLAKSYSWGKCSHLISLLFFSLN